MRINDSKMFSFRIKEFTVLKPEKSDTDAQWKTFRTSRERKKSVRNARCICVENVIILLSIGIYVDSTEKYAVAWMKSPNQTKDPVETNLQTKKITSK